jgi:hypothetical protein
MKTDIKKLERSCRLHDALADSLLVTIGALLTILTLTFVV